MDRQRILSLCYWASTLVFGAALAWSAVQYLVEAPRMQATMIDHLGYPAYFPKILAVFKLAGVLALLVPTSTFTFSRELKEWAYAGFTFDLLGATASHLSVGDSFAIALVPVAFSRVAFGFIRLVEAHARCTRADNNSPPPACARSRDRHPMTAENGKSLGARSTRRPEALVRAPDALHYHGAYQIEFAPIHFMAASYFGAAERGWPTYSVIPQLPYFVGAPTLVNPL